MKNKINNSSDFDLDLFFYFTIFNVHIATAGVNIRDEIFFNNFHNEFRYNIKNFKFSKPFEYKLNPFLDEIISIKYENDKEFDRELYTKDFISYARMGAFSFDRTFINLPNDFRFHLVAFPILNEEYSVVLKKLHGFEGVFDYNSINMEVQESINKNLNKPINFQGLI